MRAAADEGRPGVRRPLAHVLHRDPLHRLLYLVPPYTMQHTASQACSTMSHGHGQTSLHHTRCSMRCPGHKTCCVLLCFSVRRNGSFRAAIHFEICRHRCNLQTFSAPIIFRVLLGWPHRRSLRRCTLTFGVLMCMESLSAFLHALRLHWYPKCPPLLSAVVCLHWCLGAQRLAKARKALRYLWMDVCARSVTILPHTTYLHAVIDLGRPRSRGTLCGC